MLRQGGPRHRVIVRMNALLDEFDDRFDDLVADLPPRKQEAFRALLGDARGALAADRARRA